MSPSPSLFEFHSVTFRFRALDTFRFPAFLTGNLFRGALGSFLRSGNTPAYEVLFRGSSQSDPVGHPRPFVLRCRNLEGNTYRPGEIFSLHLNLFLSDLELLDPLVAALTAMSEAGFGPTRSHATLLLPPEHMKHSLPLEPAAEPIRAIRIHFHTPTELKSHGIITEPSEFPVLLAQLCARLNRLSTLYAATELALDGSLLKRRADSVALRSTNFRRVEISRRGTRSGQIHPIGGFIGCADYSGDLTPFVPLLKAAAFTGVGRHTVWGNGEISTERLD